MSLIITELWWPPYPHVSTSFSASFGVQRESNREKGVEKKQGSI